jgi:hypothetical protein
MRKTLFKKIISIVAVLLLGIPFQKVYAGDWVLFAVSMDGKIEEYYDRDTVAFPSPGIAKLTTKTIKYDSGEEGGRKRSFKGSQDGKEGLPLSAYTITRHQIECRNRIDTLLSTADYDQDGQVVHHSEVPWVIPRTPYRRSPQDMYPESVSDNLIKIVCPQTP